MLTPANRFCLYLILMAGAVMVADSAYMAVTRQSVAYFRLVIGGLGMLYVVTTFSVQIRKTLATLQQIEEARPLSSAAKRSLARSEVYLGRRAFRRNLHKQVAAAPTRGAGGADPALVANTDLELGSRNEGMP